MGAAQCKKKGKQNYTRVKVVIPIKMRKKSDVCDFDHGMSAGTRWTGLSISENNE